MWLQLHLSLWSVQKHDNPSKHISNRHEVFTGNELHPHTVSIQLSLMIKTVSKTMDTNSTQEDVIA
jgi:hypothetical protein